MPTATVNGIDLHYEVSGEGAAILCIHGSPSSALMWEDAAGQLAGHGRCISYDRRGYYRSARPDPFDSVDLDDHVEDAAALLDALSATPAVVIGRSTGGQIALELARRHPGKVRALVLLEPAMFTLDPDAAAWGRQLRLTVLREAAQRPSAAAETAVRQALGDQVWESLPEPVRDMFAAGSDAVLAEIRGRGLDLSEEPVDFSEAELARIAQPTLIISAEDSPAAFRRVNDRLAQALPGAELLLVAGGHLIDPAHPAVRTFIDQLPPPGPPA